MTEKDGPDSRAEHTGAAQAWPVDSGGGYVRTKRTRDARTTTARALVRPATFGATLALAASLLSACTSAQVEVVKERPAAGARTYTFGAVSQLCGGGHGIYGPDGAALKLSGPDDAVTLNVGESVDYGNGCSVEFLGFGPELDPSDGGPRTAWLREIRH